MNVVLSPQSEEIVRQQVAAGLYRDASEVIEEALSLLNDPHRFANFKAAVNEGFAELDRGEGIPLTSALVEDIRRTARKLAREGRTPDPDVCP